MNLSQKIERSQDRVNALRRSAEELAQSFDDEDEDSRENFARQSAEINRRLDSEVSLLEGLRRSERMLGEQSEVVLEQQQDRDPGTAVVKSTLKVPMRPWAQPKVEIKPRDYVYRALTGALLHHIEGKQRPLHAVLAERYGSDPLTHRIADIVLTRATIPATTTDSSWADTLVSTVIGDFVDALMPTSVYPGLSARGGRFTFGQAGIVSLPTRASTPSVGGGFVLQGNPIPVKQASFNAVSITPRKMGVISTFTREIAEHSTPTIEGLLRTAIQEDTAVAVDTVLLAAAAGTATQPPGLLYGVSSTNKSSNSGFTAIIEDVKALLAVLTAANALRAPTWIMNPANVLDLTLTPNSMGDFPLRAEAAAGTLGGYPILQSTTLTSDTIILLDAADFFSATGDTARFDVSDQAVLHMDTSPTAIGVDSTTPVAPVRSLWQTDTIGLRLLLDISWDMRRTGVVAYTSSVRW